jgi:hypothetical protein
MLLGLISFFLSSPKKAKQKLQKLFSRSVVSVESPHLTTQKTFSKAKTETSDTETTISKSYSHIKIEIQ